MFPMWRPGGAACTIGMLLWMALLFLGKTGLQGDGVALPVREWGCIELCLEMNEEVVEHLHVRLQRQVSVGTSLGGVYCRPG